MVQAFIFMYCKTKKRTEKTSVELGVIPTHGPDVPIVQLDSRAYLSGVIRVWNPPVEISTFKKILIRSNFI